MRNAQEAPDAVPAVRDLLDITGRVAIVTGAGAGIGSAIALRFAEAGAAVIVHYHASEAGALDVVRRIEAMGRQAMAVRANLSSWDEAERLMARTEEAFGRIDVLVNNAGTYPLHPLLQMAETDWEGVIDANLRSVFACTQAAAGRMIRSRSAGSIVNIASIEAENPAPSHSHYNAAKAGVVMFTRSAANELGQYGIRVNAVSPGLIWREGLEEQWPEGVERYQAVVPLARLGRAEDVADACLFLASPAARWISGANLVVDGGVMTHQIY
jgi:NAD(P)-dependent dehydrogenase (short-subunit alcohol dehydrogenase family)